MTNNKGKLLMFDFDGVIADTFEPVSEMIIMLASKYNLPINNAEQVRQLYTGNIYDGLKKLGMSNDGIDEFINDPAWDSIIDKTVVVEGMDKLLFQLSKQTDCIIISSADSEWIQSVLDRYSIRQCFSAIYPKETSLSKVHKIQKALNDYSYNKTDAYYIGDTVGDIQEAHEAGVAAIAVTWGYHSKHDLESAKPDYIVETIKDLEKLLKQR